jgi:lipopolysaccharide biosynthesis glycosyltransferase
MDTNVARVFVGADRSQLLAVKVLEHSIKRHSSIPVEVLPMVDLPVPVPVDPRNSQRTGFSFSRFCIPKLAGYRGRAVYMDADMLVFGDIRELWEIPFNDAKVVIQKEVKHTEFTTAKEGAPKQRMKQCAVMLLDCDRLNWRIDDIVAGMNEGRYNYERLMFDLCILEEREINYGVPFEWNSLEHYDNKTRLLHYTDMLTQPWASTRNKLGEFWYREVRAMLSNGSLTWAEVKREIDLGFLRPSLMRDLRWRHWLPSFLKRRFDRTHDKIDNALGYVAHKAVYDQKRVRNRAIKKYERTRATDTQSSSSDQAA